MTCSRAVDRSRGHTEHFAAHLPQRGADGGVMRSHVLPSGRPLARSYRTVRGAPTAARRRRRGDALARALHGARGASPRPCQYITAPWLPDASCRRCSQACCGALPRCRIWSVLVSSRHTCSIPSRAAGDGVSRAARLCRAVASAGSGTLTIHLRQPFASCGR